MLEIDNFVTGFDIHLVVKSDKDQTVLLAFSLNTPEGPKSLLTFDDDNHVRVIDVLTTIEDSADRLIVMSDQGMKYTFEPLTLENYNSYVKGKLWVNPDFKTADEMYAYFDDHDDIIPSTFPKSVE